MTSQLFLATLFSALIAFPPSAFGASILLDAETPATGSNLASTPLNTPLGTISFVGIVVIDYERDLGPRTNHLFSTDNGLVEGTTGQFIEPARFLFDFDVQSMSFIYGGNDGDILIEALDASGVLVDSFFQKGTGTGAPVGPIALSGMGIREVRFEDPSLVGTTTNPSVLAALDNITITAVPEPSSFLLLLFALPITQHRRRSSRPV